MTAVGLRGRGYVIDDSSYRITAVRLRVDGTDPDGQALEDTVSPERSQAP